MDRLHFSGFVCTFYYSNKHVGSRVHKMDLRAYPENFITYIDYYVLRIIDMSLENRLDGSPSKVLIFVLWQYSCDRKPTK